MAFIGIERITSRNLGLRSLSDTYLNEFIHKGLPWLGNKLGIGFLKRLGYDKRPFAEVCLERLTRFDDLRRSGNNSFFLNKTEYGVYNDLRNLVGPDPAQEILQGIRARPVQHELALDEFPIEVKTGIDTAMIARLGRLGAILDIEPGCRSLVSPGSDVTDTDRLPESAYISTLNILLSREVVGEEIFLHPSYTETRRSVFQEANRRFCRDDEE